MKIVVCLLFLLGLWSGQADEDHRRRLVLSHRLRPARDVHYHDKQPETQNNDTKSDEDNNEEEIERPCPDYDVDCIRKFFAHHSKCTPVYGSVPDPLYLKRVSMNMPHANISVTIYDVQVTGLSYGQITEFYINKAKDILVLGVEFNKVVAWCPKTVISYYRKNKEPIELTDISVLETKSLSLTLTVRNVNDINLAESHVYSYVPDPKPQLIMGASLEDITHTDLSTHSLIWRDNIGLTVREAYITHGSNYMTAFLQKKICDFTKIENKSKESDTA